MDKLCPKFDRDFYPGDVLGEDPSANAIASLENSDVQAGAREFGRAAESSRSGANDQRCLGHAFTMQDLERKTKLGCLPGIRTPINRFRADRPTIERGGNLICGGSR